MSGLKAYFYNERRWVDLPEGELIIGRDRSCDCPINDDTVSWHHLRLVVQRKIIEVEDLGSTNGTRVNGEPLVQGSRQLGKGDFLQAGRVVFVIDSAGLLNGMRSFLSRLLGRGRRPRPQQDSQPVAA